MILRLVSAIGLVIILLSQPLATKLAATSIKRDVMDTKPKGDNTEAEARRLWEYAIAAKGGRDRLNAVRNMVVSSRWQYRTASGRTNPVRQEQFFVFPNKYWFWNDLRPDVFGLTVEMYNYETNIRYIATPEDPRTTLEPMITGAKNPSLINAQLFYLLGTEWVKPMPVTATKGRIGRVAVDIVQTEVNNQRVDFALDQETHLPICISEYRKGDGDPFYVQYLSDYVEKNGIKIPLTLKGHQKDRSNKMDIQINVEYDESIFVKPPPIEAGPDAWRPKKVVEL